MVILIGGCKIEEEQIESSESYVAILVGGTKERIEEEFIASAFFDSGLATVPDGVAEEEDFMIATSKMEMGRKFLGTLLVFAM